MLTAEYCQIGSIFRLFLVCNAKFAYFNISAQSFLRCNICLLFYKNGSYNQTEISIFLILNENNSHTQKARRCFITLLFKSDEKSVLFDMQGNALEEWKKAVVQKHCPFAPFHVRKDNFSMNSMTEK